MDLFQRHDDVMTLTTDCCRRICPGSVPSSTVFWRWPAEHRLRPQGWRKAGGEPDNSPPAMAEPPVAPPASLPAEPLAAPPPASTAAVFDAEAPTAPPADGDSEFSFTKNAFTVNVLGKRISGEAAQKLIIAFGGLIVLLVVAVAVSGDSDVQATSDSPVTAGAVGGDAAPPPPSSPFTGGPPPPPPAVRLPPPPPPAPVRPPPPAPPAVRPPPPPPPPVFTQPAPPPPCVDDASCDALISQLGCTHDLHASEAQIPLGTLVQSICPAACNICQRESWLDALNHITSPIKNGNFDFDLVTDPRGYVYAPPS